MLTVLVADDQELVRRGFVSLLATADDIEVVGEAENGRDAVWQVRQLRPDVALMDIRMPEMNGIDAIEEIRSDAILATRIIVLTTFGLDDYVFGALRAGADAFLLKDTSPDELLSSIRLVSQGDAVMSPSVTRTMLDDYLRRPTTLGSRRAPELTEREYDVLRGVCDGLGNRAIADRLYLGVATVKTYASRLFDKFGVDSRVQLVIAAYECGLLRDQQTR